MTVNRRDLSMLSIPISSKRGLYRGTGFYWGVTHNRSTSGSFSRQTGKLILYTPIILSSISWDIRNTGTYKCSFITTSSGSTDLYVVQSSLVVGAAGTITIPVIPEIILMPGIYYLSLYRAAGAVTWWDGPVYTTSDLDTSSGVWYDGTGYGTYYFPGALNGKKLMLPGISSFAATPV